MDVYDQSTYYYPYATSLRMGDIGYQNNAESEAGFKACYDNLHAYVNSLSYAIQTPCPHYADIGVIKNGEYRQLNANILQIENEYYSTVRPKQPPSNNERPGLALRDRGIRYVELRSLDVNVFDPLGINEDQLRFLEAFMAFCLLQDSPPISRTEALAIDKNEIAAAHQGRDPLLRLIRPEGPVLLRDWAQEICELMEGFCAVLDEAVPGHPYTTSLQVQKAAVADPENTLSARMLREMRERGESFHDFGRRLSRQHARYYANRALSAEHEAQFLREAARSSERQREIEAADHRSFEAYLEHYYAQR
jgi:glutamate--cysteine ligase